MSKREYLIWLFLVALIVSGHFLFDDWHGFWWAVVFMFIGGTGWYAESARAKASNKLREIENE